MLSRSVRSVDLDPTDSEAVPAQLQYKIRVFSAQILLATRGAFEEKRLDECSCVRDKRGIVWGV